MGGKGSKPEDDFDSITTGLREPQEAEVSYPVNYYKCFCCPCGKNELGFHQHDIFITAQESPCNVAFWAGDMVQGTKVANIRNFHVAKSDRKTLVLFLYLILSLVLGMFVGGMMDESDQQNAFLGTFLGLFVILFIVWLNDRTGWVHLYGKQIPTVVVPGAGVMSMMTCEIDPKDSDDVIGDFWRFYMGDQGLPVPDDSTEEKEAKNYISCGIPNGQDRLTLRGPMAQARYTRGCCNIGLISTKAYDNFDLKKLKMLTFGFSGRPVEYFLIPFAIGAYFMATGGSSSSTPTTGTTTAGAGNGTGAGTAGTDSSSNSDQGNSGMIPFVIFTVIGIVMWWFSAQVFCTVCVQGGPRPTVRIPQGAGDKVASWLFARRTGMPSFDTKTAVERKVFKGKARNGNLVNFKIYEDHLEVKQMQAESGGFCARKWAEIAAPSTTHLALLQDVSYVRAERESGFKTVMRCVELLLLGMFLSSKIKNDEGKADMTYVGICALVALIVFIVWWCTRKMYIVIGPPAKAGGMGDPLAVEFKCKGITSAQFCHSVAQFIDEAKAKQKLAKKAAKKAMGV